MITSKGWLSLLFLILPFIPCQARLGENLDAIKARFGAPWGVNPDEAGVTTLTYLKDGFQIVVSMYQGISQFEEYHPRTNENFSDAEIQVLLADEADGKTWTPDPTNPRRKWMRTDQALALFEPNNLRFTVWSAEFRASQATRDQKIKDAKEAEKMDTLKSF